MGEMYDETTDLTPAADETPDVSAGAEATPDVTDAAEAAETATAPTTTPDDFYSSPQFQQAVQEQAQQQAEQQVLQILQQAIGGGGEGYGPPQLPEIDPYAEPEEFAAQMQAHDQALLQQARVMFEEQFAPIQSAFATNRINELAAETASAQQYKDAGITAEDVETIGNAFVSNYEGQGEYGVKAALRDAAEYLANVKRTAGQAAVEAYKKGIGEAAGMSAEPGVGGGATISANQPPKTYEEATARVFARHGISYPN